MDNRLSNIRRHLGINQHDFAISLGISQSMYSKLESNAYPLSDRNKRIIEEKYNITPGYLDGENVPMFTNVKNILSYDEIEEIKAKFEEMKKRVEELEYTIELQKRLLDQK